MGNVLVIGLDGVPYKFINMWKIKIPIFHKIISRSVYAVLKSTIPSQTSVALPSLFTGKNPGKTGIFDFIDNYENLVRIDNVKHPKLWEILGDYGIKSLFYNTRMIYPLPKSNNCVFIDSGLFSIEDTLCEPEEYARYLHEFPKEGELIELRLKKKASQEELAEKIVEFIECKYNIFRKLISDESFEFILYWIGETDILHHYCWGNNKLLLETYTKILHILNKMVHDFKGWDIFIISDHGCERKPNINFYVDQWLSSRGYLKMKKNYKLISLLYLIARKVLPFKIRNKFVKISSSTRDGASNRYHGINYEESLAFYSRDWGISINSRVSEIEYEKLRSTLIKELSALEFRGKKVFREVLRREDIYSGQFIHKVPDIVLRASEEFELKPGPSLKIFGKSEKNRYNYVGSHNWAREGIFLAFGPDIKGTGEFIGELQIYDIMPTVLHVYGIPIPEDVDGRVLKEIFREESDAYRREPKYMKIDRERMAVSSKIRELKKLGKLRS